MRAASATWRASSGAPSAAAVCQASSSVAQRAAGVAARPCARSPRRRRPATLDPELGRAARDDGRDLLVGERLQLDDGAAGEQRGVDLEVGVLGRRPDQRQQPALDAGEERILLALVEAVDLVEEQDRPRRRWPRAGRGRAGARRGRRRRVPRRPRAPRTRRPWSRRRCARASSCRPRAGRRGSSTAAGRPRSRAAAPSPSPSTCRWPTSSSSDRGRMRCGSGASGSARRGRVREEVGHGVSVGERRLGHRPRTVCPPGAERPVCAPACSVPMSQETWEPPLNRPVLPGEARTDYERYLNTEELLALQKSPDEWVHRGRAAVPGRAPVVRALAQARLERHGRCGGARRARTTLGAALRLLRRASMCMRFITGQLDMLEQMSPWEYQEIRKVLGHGSGFDSPGRQGAAARDGAARRGVPRRRERAGLSLLDLYVQGREHEQLYQLAEALMELDEWMQTWRIRHYRVVARVIGEHVIGTQGTPVEVLGRLIHRVRVPGALGRAQRADREVPGRVVTLREEVTALLQALLRANTVNPPGNETRRRGAAARLPRGERHPVRARRPLARPPQSRRAADGRRRPVARAARAHRHRARRSRRSGRAIRGRATSSTARSGGAARST